MSRVETGWCRKIASTPTELLFKPSRSVTNLPMATTETTPSATEGHPPADDSLQVDYRLTVSAGSKSVTNIAGQFEIHSALHPEARRDTAANFSRLMGLLLLQPALIQLNGFITDRRRADIAARDAAEQSQPGATSAGSTMPVAEEPEAPPALAAAAPLAPLTA